MGRCERSLASGLKILTSLCERSLASVLGYHDILRQENSQNKKDFSKQAKGPARNSWQASWDDLMRVAAWHVFRVMAGKPPLSFDGWIALI